MDYIENDSAISEHGLAALALTLGRALAWLPFMLERKTWLRRVMPFQY